MHHRRRQTRHGNTKTPNTLVLSTKFLMLMIMKTKHLCISDTESILFSRIPDNQDIIPATVTLNRIRSLSCDPKKKEYFDVLWTVLILNTLSCCSTHWQDHRITNQQLDDGDNLVGIFKPACLYFSARLPPPLSLLPLGSHYLVQTSRHSCSMYKRRIHHRKRKTNLFSRSSLRGANCNRAPRRRQTQREPQQIIAVSHTERPSGK